MPKIDEKTIVIKQVIIDVDRMIPGDTERHLEYKLGLPWKARVQKTSYSLEASLMCRESEAETDGWLINSDYEVKVVGKDTSLTLKGKHTFHDGKRSILESFSVPHVYNYTVWGNLTLEWHLKIHKFLGIKMESRPKIELPEKEDTKIVFTVAGEKFHVNKRILFLHSAYFRAMFSAELFQKYGVHKVPLNDIDPTDFRNFLAVVEGKTKVIDDDTVEGILFLAHKYTARTVTKKCENFLINESDRSLKMRFNSAIKYKLEKLKKSCIWEVSTRKEMREIADEDVENLDAETWKALLQKSLEFKY